MRQRRLAPDARRTESRLELARLAVAGPGSLYAARPRETGRRRGASESQARAKAADAGSRFAGPGGPGRHSSRSGAGRPCCCPLRLRTRKGPQTQASAECPLPSAGSYDAGPARCGAQTAPHTLSARPYPVTGRRRVQGRPPPPPPSPQPSPPLSPPQPLTV